MVDVMVVYLASDVLLTNMMDLFGDRLVGYSFGKSVEVYSIRNEGITHLEPNVPSRLYPWCCGDPPHLQA